MTEPIDPNALPPQPVFGEQQYPPPYAPPPASAPSAPYPPYRPDSPYPAYQASWTEPAPPPTGRRVATWVWAVAGVATLLAVLAVATVVGHGGRTDEATGTAGRTLVLPSAASGYSKVQTLDITQLLTQLGGAVANLGISADELDHMQAAVYARPAHQEQTFVVVGVQVSDIPRLQDEIDARGLSAAVQEFAEGAAMGGGGLSGSVTGEMKSVAPGPLGGSMRCGLLSIIGRDIGLCGWGDRSAFAVCMLVNPASLDQAVTLTRAFRAAAEH